jgi:hypothetical protein
VTASLDHQAVQRNLDAAFHYGGLVVRAVGYTMLYAFAAHYELAQPVLAGALCGDVFGQLCLLVRRGRSDLPAVTGDLLTLAVVAWCVREQLAWPTDQGLQAVFGLAALGALIGSCPGLVGRAEE